MLIVGIEDDSYASVLLCSCDDFWGGDNVSVVSNIEEIISLLLPQHELKMILLI